MYNEKNHPTKIAFRQKDHLKFEDQYMKIHAPLREYAAFECIN